MTAAQLAQYGYADLEPLMALMTGDEKHGPAATSTLDVLWVLYDRILNIDPADPDASERDRFVLSKATARWPITPCSQPRGSSTPACCPALPGSARRSATTPTGP